MRIKLDLFQGGRDNGRMDNKDLSKMVDSLIEQLNYLKSVLDSRETPESAEARRKADKGICPYCGEPHGDDLIIRGTHQRCHRKINRAIHAKVITDQQAVARGWLLSAEKGGRKFDEDDLVGKEISTKSRRPGKKS